MEFHTNLQFEKVAIEILQVGADISAWVGMCDMVYVVGHISSIK